MNEGGKAQALTEDDFRQAVAQAGGPKAVKATFHSLQLANAQLDKDYSRILEQYTRHWIAMGPDGMVANVPVPEDSTEEEEEQALERLFELIEESGSNKKGCLVLYIDPEGGAR